MCLCAAIPGLSFPLPKRLLQLARYHPMAFVSEMAEAIAVVSFALEPRLYKQLPRVQVLDTQIVEDL